VALGEWEKLRRILGFKFNPPKNGSNSDKDDQGVYVRCTLPSGTKLFVLPSKYLMQKQEAVVVEEAGGYTKPKRMRFGGRLETQDQGRRSSS
jgi:hypothetical protein